MTRKMRPTLSRDGQYRASVRPLFRVSYSMLLDCLAEMQPWEGAGGNKPTFPQWSAEQVMAKVHDALISNGSHSKSGLYDELVEFNPRCAQWCEDMAAKVWPTTT